jgi:hypothetical protein
MQNKANLRKVVTNLTCYFKNGYENRGVLWLQENKPNPSGPSVRHRMTHHSMPVWNCRTDQGQFQKGPPLIGRRSLGFQKFKSTRLVFDNQPTV